MLFVIKKFLTYDQTLNTQRLTSSHCNYTLRSENYGLRQKIICLTNKNSKRNMLEIFQF